MKKKIILVLAALLLVCASVGCIAVEETEEEETTVTYKYHPSSDYISDDKIYIWVDKTTGVEYLIYADGNRGGICQYYNADGTLRINEEFRK